MAARAIFGSTGLDADLTAILGLENEAAPAKVARPSTRSSLTRGPRSAPLFPQQAAPQPASADHLQKEPAPQPLEAPPASPQQRLFARFSRRALPPSSPLDVPPVRSRQQMDSAPASERTVAPSTEKASPAPTQKPYASSLHRQPVRSHLFCGPTAKIAASVALILAVGTAVMMFQAPVERGGPSKSLPISAKPSSHGVGPKASVPAVEQAASADPLHANHMAGQKDPNLGYAPVPGVAGTGAVEGSPVPALNAPAPAPVPARSAPVRLAQARSTKRAKGFIHSRFVPSPSVAGAEVATAYAAIPATQPVKVETAGAVTSGSAAPSGRAELARISQPARGDAPSIDVEATVPAPRVRRDGVDAIRALRRQ